MHLTCNDIIYKVHNYYPFGGVIDNGVRRGVDVQNHLCNGKKLDRMHGLNLYDYSARQYDAAIGQFTSMDPLCEKYYHISPYAYCAGNPVKYVDPDGKAIKIRYVDTKGRVQHFVFRDTGQKGYVKVPKSRNNFVKNVVGAYFYNKRNFTKMFPGEQSGLMKLVQREDNKNTVTVKERKNNNAYFHRENTIYWDPFAASENTNGVTISPATGLAHEGEHANNNTESDQSSQAYHSRVNTPNDVFKNEEEKTVITGGEQKQAEANGEVERGQKTRENHEGIFYPVNNYWQR